MPSNFARQRELRLLSSMEHCKDERVEGLILEKISPSRTTKDGVGTCKSMSMRAERMFGTLNRNSRQSDGVRLDETPSDSRKDAEKSRLALFNVSKNGNRNGILLVESSRC